MIIISQDVLVSFTQQANADYPMLLWENLATEDEADSELITDPAINLLHPSTVEGWASDILDVQHVTFTVDGFINAVGIAEHNLGSGLIHIAIDGLSGDVGAVWEELLPSMQLPNDEPHMFVLDRINLIGVRLRLTPQDVTKPEIAVAYVGEALHFPYGIQPGNPPINYGYRREVATGRAEAGHFLGRIITRESRATQVTIRNLTPAWWRANLVRFLEAAGDTPFFFAWRPLTYPNESGYVWATVDIVPVPSHLVGYTDLTMQIEGIA